MAGQGPLLSAYAASPVPHPPLSATLLSAPPFPVPTFLSAPLLTGSAPPSVLREDVSALRPEGWCDFLAGCLGGTAGLAFGYPFDTIKVRQQTTCVTMGGAPSAALTAHSALTRQGVRLLYRGMAFPLASEGLRNSLFFGLYGLLLDASSDSGGRLGGAPGAGQVALAAGVAGAVQGAVATPIELVKVVLQANNGSRLYTGPIDCLQKIYAHHGTPGIFRGFQITVAREAPSLATYMVAYHYLRAALTGEGRDQPPLAADLLAGGLSGVLSWLVNMPVDVVKTRLQSDDPARPRYAGALDCCVQSYRAEGLRTFWRGLTVTCLRAFPTNAVTLVVYSKSLNYLQQQHRQRRQQKQQQWDQQEGQQWGQQWEQERVEENGGCLELHSKLVDAPVNNLD